MTGSFRKIRLGFLLLTLTLAAISRTVQGEVTDFAYSTLDSQKEAKFRIGFWQDPDLSLLQFSHDSFREKLRLFGRRFEQAMRDPLVAADFGDVKISIISDYETLFDERVLGRFDLLHCDPASYVLLRNVVWDPYTPLLEETSRDPDGSKAAGIWVREDSPHRTPQDLVNKKIAIVAPTSLFGGALQRARLWNAGDRPLREGREFRAIPTGSAAEGILRLVTGLGTDDPIEAAFLPGDGVGFQAAAQLLGVRRPESIPIRRIDEFASDEFPGPPLLINRITLETHPGLGDALAEFFEEEKLPWAWRRTEESQYERLAEILSQLPPIESDAP